MDVCLEFSDHILHPNHIIPEKSTQTQSKMIFILPHHYNLGWTSKLSPEYHYKGHDHFKVDHAQSGHQFIHQCNHQPKAFKYP